MDGIFDSLEAAKVRAIEGDFIDTLHSKASIVFLFANLILIVFKLGDNPILCWTPTHFSDAQDEFAHQFCWINSTYWYRHDNAEKFRNSQRSELSYYQYIIFILSLQCVSFFLPAFLWKNLISGSIQFINSSLQAADRTKVIPESIETFKSLSGDDKNEMLNKKSVKFLSDETSEKLLLSMKPLIDNVKKPRRLIPVHIFKFVAIKYIFLKFFYLANLIVQFYFLSKIFKTNFFTYGINFIQTLWKDGNQIFLTKEFPIFTLCDFFIHMPLDRRYENTIQCLLPVNILIEKLYFLIWSWYIGLFFLTLLNIISWVLEFTSPAKKGLIEKYLFICRELTTNDVAVDKNEKENIKKFLSSYLKNDGVLLILLIKSVCGDIIFLEVLNILWNNFIQTKK